FTTTTQAPSPGCTGPIGSATTGAILATNLNGQQFNLADSCPAGAPSQICFNPNPAARQYVPATVATPATLCPSCQGASTLENSIECCDLRTYSCGGTTTLDTTADTIITKGAVQNAVDNGFQCLIQHPGQATIDATDLQAGTGPARITAGSGPQSGQLVTTSKSIATFPIIDTPITPPPAIRVVGFLQLFINSTSGSPGNFSVTVLNVIGCGNNATSSVVGKDNSTSPIPVGLIH